MDRFDLSHKVALVTGAAGMLGIEHVSALLEQGAAIVMTDVNEDSLKDVYNSLVSEDTKNFVYLARIEYETRNNT